MNTVLCLLAVNLLTGIPMIILAANSGFGSVGARALADSLLANHTLTELDLSKEFALSKGINYGYHVLL
jgi:hypothetical protein